MGIWVLVILYSALIVLEAVLLHRILGVELKLDFTNALMDSVVVNMISLVLIVVLFGPALARMDTGGTQIYFFRTMMITWPQEIIKICLFSIVSDAVALGVWYHYRFPERHWLEVATKGALMNVPAFVIAGMTWAFVAIIYEFFKFLRIT